MSNSVILDRNLPPLPEDLLLARDRGEVLFVVGAGASYPKPSSLPNFDGLVSDIYKNIDPMMVDAITTVRKDDALTWETVPQLLTHLQRTELKFFCQREYDVVLGMLERRLDGDPHKQSTMRREALKVLARTAEPNMIHNALVQLGQRFGQTLLATTNFDRLLSQAAKKQRYLATAYALGKIPNPSRSTEFNGILHIHGKLPIQKESGSALILTDQDFGDAYLRRHSITSFLYDAARIFHLVLVGYSANDSPVRYLLNAIAADERHFVDLKPRYAFVGCDSADERTPIEWQARGITPIKYDKSNEHQALIDVLVKWSEIIPDKKNKKHIYNYLKRISVIDHDAPESAAAQSFLAYYIRRSTSLEQAELAGIFSKKNSSPNWLSFLNKIIRESARER